MSNVTSFETNAGKCNLTQNDLLDRVINLKLVTGSSDSDNPSDISKVEDTYYIRSDYEAIYKTLGVTSIFKKDNKVNNEYYIRKCVYKPSIKVTYKRVSPNSPVEIDIYVANFFMLDSTGKKLMSFSNADYPLKKVEIMMGYWGQFKNMAHSSLEDLHTFTPSFGVDKIDINVSYVTTDKLPPDSTIHIHGYIGSTIFANSVSNVEYSTFDEAIDGGLTDSFSKTAKSGYALSEYFYTHITRRYLKNNILDEDISSLVLENGLLKEADAEAYGIKVYCSAGVIDLSKNTVEVLKIGSDEDTTDNVTSSADGVTPENTFANSLSNIINSLLKAQLNNGDWIVYTREEAKDISTLMQTFYDYKGKSYNYEDISNLKSYYEHILPAVYNINIDALATIVSPFFYFVDPFNYVKFVNRYALSSQTAYYSNADASKTKYFVIQQTVSFATVENVNEMTLISQATGGTDE